MSGALFTSGLAQERSTSEVMIKAWMREKYRPKRLLTRPGVFRRLSLLAIAKSAYRCRLFDNCSTGGVQRVLLF
jgi:hypothetical protein